jgi:hypothetical protein
MTDGLLGPGGKDSLQTRHEFQVVPRLRLAVFCCPHPNPLPEGEGAIGGRLIVPSPFGRRLG